MMLHIPGVLDAAALSALQQDLQAAEWHDGRATVGTQGAVVKRNRQIDAGSALGQRLSAQIEAAVRRHPLFFAAALPLTISPPLFNRYESTYEEHYGFHVDGAMRSMPQPGSWMRTDLSATLFLCEPDTYDGGDLTVRDTYGDHEVKLPAGDLILYPSSSLHSVSTLTRGTRTCAFFWIQSMIRADHQRTMLFELDQTIQALREKHGESAEALTLSNLYHNLLREWSLA